ncbi:MAG TPA: NADH-quinone oxidoreductase subunit NuoN [Alphaproteobacteria bacterium]|nr:NADH-quinone oxidoreductase subunit NuoN [Alphaproteobacteria bacterium]
MDYLQNLTLALPEIWLAVCGMALLMIGVFAGESAARVISWLSALALVVAGVLVVFATPDRSSTALGGLFITDSFGAFMKLLVLAGSILSLVMSLDYNEREKIARFEFPVLFVFATTGMFMMISANDLISLYIGLELQNLSLYVVASFQRDSIRSTEAGLKYFVLGALSSGLLLYGASLVYGFAGTTRFGGLAHMLIAHNSPALGVIIGIVFIAAALAFKVSAVPFHMWTPDVYEGAPTPVTAFFAAAPKIAALALFVRVLIEPFGPLVAQWQQIIVFISIASMALGSYAAINQKNIKRLMAYSSIANVGYVLVGLAAGNEAGVRGVMIYMAIYLAMVIGAFACILCMRENGRYIETIEDLAGLSHTQPLLAAVFGVFLFSLAGIPPLAGFFGKLYVFLAAIEAKLYALAVIGVLTSVVGAYYYVRIVKIMYFDEPTVRFDRPLGAPISAVLTVTGLVTLLFFAYPAPILAGAKLAAATLFPG